MSETTTKSRLALAAAQYERASNRLGYVSAPPATVGSRAYAPSIRVGVGAYVATSPAVDVTGGFSLGDHPGYDVQATWEAFAAGRTLERCIVEHRFGRKEPVTHKWYGVDGEEVRVTKAYAAGDHNFPESTPWLP